MKIDIPGYTLIENEFVKETNSQALVFKHDKTGARLFKLQNDDNNKVFIIGFRTPPKDSTGVAHIVEHCVLSGSRKYKTKEPFMDMVKTSQATFINAMTYPDKTVYPVASRNPKDFKNLMDLYLDAVFYPAMKENKYIFAQEGWHRQLLDRDDEIVYNGVVYNEMKGAMSSPDDQVAQLVDKYLYPDSVYGNNSGGDPYEIPNLSYEDFCDFHDKFYHPSNSYIYLYGNGDLEEELAHIDEYLSDFDYLEVDSKIDLQPKWDKYRYVEDYYSVTEDLEGDNNAYLTYAMIGADSTEVNTAVGAEILREAFVDVDGAKIKEALLDSGIGESVYSMGSLHKRDMPFVIVAKNAEARQVDDFVAVVEQSVREIFEDGLDRDQVFGLANKYLYQLKEAGGFATKGLIYGLTAFTTWLHDMSPLPPLKYESIFEALTERFSVGYCEYYLQTQILESNHKSIGVFTPKKDMFRDRDERLREELLAHKGSLTFKEIDEIIEENKKLLEFQSAEDMEEAKATIPVLRLEDVDTEIEGVPREVEEIEGSTYLYHDIDTGGINYIDFVYDLSHIEKEDVKYVELLSSLFGSMGTENFSYYDFAVAESALSGGISLGVGIYTDYMETDKFYPKLIVSSKTMSDDLSDLVGLIREMLCYTKLDDKARYKDILNEVYSDLESNIYLSGSALVMNRAKSYFSESAAYKEEISGLSYYKFIQGLVREGNYDEDLEKLKEVYQKVFNLNNLILNFSGSREGYESFVAASQEVIENLPSLVFEKKDFSLKIRHKTEGFTSSSNVQYVGKSAPLEGIDYSGKLQVAAQVISREYLHNEIRAKGGAYGSGIKIGKDGITTYSYRDPNLEKTIDVYKGIGDFLRNLDMSQEELDSVIIGTLNSFIPPLTQSQKGRRDLSWFIRGIDKADLEKEIAEVMDTKVEDLKGLADFFDTAMGKEYLTVLGSKTKIESASKLFDSVQSLS